MPTTLPVTVTVKMHWVPPVSEPFVQEMPVGAVSVTVPPQTVALALGTLRPVGSVSVKPTPVSVLALGFVVENWRPVVLPRVMLLGIKVMAMLGGDTAKADGARARPHSRASKKGDTRSIPAASRLNQHLRSDYVKVLTDYVSVRKCPKSPKK